MKFIKWTTTVFAIVAGFFTSLIALMLVLLQLDKIPNLTTSPELVTYSNLTSGQQLGFLISLLVYGFTLVAGFWSIRRFAHRHLKTDLTFPALADLFKNLAILALISGLASGAAQLFGMEAGIVVDFKPALVLGLISLGLAKLPQIVKN